VSKEVVESSVESSVREYGDEGSEEEESETDGDIQGMSQNQKAKSTRTTRAPAREVDAANAQKPAKIATGSRAPPGARARLKESREKRSRRSDDEDDDGFGGGSSTLTTPKKGKLSTAPALIAAFESPRTPGQADPGFVQLALDELKDLNGMMNAHDGTKEDLVDRVQSKMATITRILQYLR
jgi:hypothetical protein